MRTPENPKASKKVKPLRQIFNFLKTDGLFTTCNQTRFIKLQKVIKLLYADNILLCNIEATKPNKLSN